MGGKTSTSTSEVSIPPEVLKRYNIANAKAAKAANKPFQKYKGEFVAGLNNQQKRGFQTINDAKNAATPYYDQATQYMTQGTQTVSPEELNIEKYYSPYQSEVIDSTAKLIDQGNEQAMSGSLGDAIKSGGFGGDRAGVAAAVLAGQQQAQRANTLAGLKQQGYTQALGAAQQQQGVDLAARQADNARYLEAANQSMGLGTAAQQNALATGESQINAGTLQQQTKQAELTAKYQQFLQKRGYPFQTAQFLANIAMGTGSLSGSTTTTEQPAPFFSDRRLKKDIKRIGQTDEGLPIYTYKYKGDEETHIGPMADEVEKIHPEAVGVAAGYKTVDYDKATGKADGGVVGAYGHQVGSDPYDPGYVPDDWLKVGELLKADPSVFQKPTSGWDEIQSIAGMGKQLVSMKDTASEIGGWFKDGKASGGGVGAAYLSAAPEPPDPDETLGNVINQQEEDNQTARELKASATPPPQQSGAASLGQAAGGVGSLLSGLAGIFALSDERAKTDIKRIGWTDVGKLPIYSFKYKGDEKSQTHIGPMAQDVEKVRPDAVKEFGGLKHVDLERATRRYGGVAGYADGGVPQLVEELPTGVVPDEAVYGELVKPEYKETPRRYVPPGHSLSELDGQTLIKNRDPVGVVPKLETKTIKEQPTISEAKIVEETPLRSVDTPKAFAKVLRAGKGWTEVIDPEGKVIRREGTRNWRNNNPGNIEYGDTAKRLGAIGTDGRFAVFPTYEMGRKAKESLLFDNPNYKDKSISKAIYRYAPPEENDTEGYIAALTKSLGLDRDTRLSDLTPEQRTVMMDAMQRVEGFKPGRSFVNGVQSAAEDVASGVKQAATTVADGAKEIPSGILSGIRNVGDKTGDVISDTTGGIRNLVKNATSNQDLMLSILSGLGTMASSDSRYLGSAILQGIGGGAKTYADLQKQSADIRATDTASRAQAINSVFDSIKPVDGVNHIIDENGNLVKFWDAVRNPEFRGIGGKMLDETVKKMAIDAYRQGKDPNRITFGNTVQTAPVEASKVEGLPDDKQPAITPPDDTGGKIIQSEVPVTAPEGVAWNKPSQDAILANQQLLSQQPTMRIPLLEQTQKDVAEAAKRAQASIEAAPQITEQASIVTDAISDKNMGTMGNWYADNVVKPYNALARSLGWGEVNGPPNADTQKIMLGKLSTLNAQNLKPEDQSSYQALSDFMEVSPNLEMTPEAASLITSQQMTRNQRAIDRANYMTSALQQSPTGEGVWTQANEKAFNSEMGDLYLTEQDNISNLMRLAEKDGRVRKFMHEAKAGAFTGEDGAEKAQAILERLLGERVSPILYRYFQRG